MRELADTIDVDAGELLAAGMLHEAQHRLLSVLGGPGPEGAVARAAADTDRSLGTDRLLDGLRAFTERNPPLAVADGTLTLDAELDDPMARASGLEEAVIAMVAADNPALIPFRVLYVEPTPEPAVLAAVTEAFAEHLAVSGPSGIEGRRIDLMDVLRAPTREAPHSLGAQLRLIRDHWGPLLGDLLDVLQLALDLMAEQDHALRLRWATGAGGGDNADPHLGIRGPDDETDEERFSDDRDWMPRVVLIAKSTYVWLDQLSKAYGREIRTLDAIPDEELATLGAQGITGLWLIGLWQRSHASAEIKHMAGDHDAVASAYSLDDYRIADDLGGEAALQDLGERAMRHGIRLASDMVPNHMGLDSRWVIEHPERFLALPVSPIPSYRFSGPDISRDDRVSIRIEDGYWDRTDAAVVFQRVDRGSGETRYIYHGNDGTSMPWNDTAQLDYLRTEVREAVMATILDVAKRFPIIRFDAAMTLARKHIQRLWYPPPGGPGDAIPTRVGYGISNAAFARAMPREFWREVVDRVAAEAPDTLLLAEAFWMLEGYFVRSLGMHRVYNSAFMHMLRDERNAEYRALIKETLAFDPEVLKRFVNFLNNPDERTAVDQFGDDDRYFCAATLDGHAARAADVRPRADRGLRREVRHGVPARPLARGAEGLAHRAPRAGDLPAAASAAPVRRGARLPTLRPGDGRRGGRGCLRVQQPPWRRPCPGPRPQPLCRGRGQPADVGARLTTLRRRSPAWNSSRWPTPWACRATTPPGPSSATSSRGARACAAAPACTTTASPSRCVPMSAACCSTGGSSTTATAPWASWRPASAGMGPCHRSMRPSRASAPSGARRCEPDRPPERPPSATSAGAAEAPAGPPWRPGRKPRAERLGERRRHRSTGDATPKSAGKPRRAKPASRRHRVRRRRGH